MEEQKGCEKRDKAQSGDKCWQQIAGEEKTRSQKVETMTIEEILPGFQLKFGGFWNGILVCFYCLEMMNEREIVQNMSIFAF